MKLLVDEQLSPSLVERLAGKGIFAQHVAHVGLSGKSDPTVWRWAYEQDQIVVTANAGDFTTLAAEVELHPGLIVVRASGLTRDEQWAWLEPVIDHLAETATSLINRVVEIWGEGEFDIRDLPRE